MLKQTHVIAMSGMKLMANVGLMKLGPVFSITLKPCVRQEKLT